MTLRQRAIPCDTVRHWRVPGRVLHIVQVETVSAQASMVATETKRKLTWKQRVLIALALCAAGVIYAVAAFLDEMAGYAGDRDGPGPGPALVPAPVRYRSIDFRPAAGVRVWVTPGRRAGPCRWWSG